jgi:LuxR family maltose regulon positive regulatory protein
LTQKYDLPLGQNWARYFLGCVAYERQELDAARICFLTVSEQRYLANAMTMRDSLVGLGLTYQAQGRAVEAHEVLRDLQGYAIESNHPAALQAAQALETRLALAAGDLDTAHALFTALDHPPSPPTPLFFLDPPPIIQVRILLAEGSSASLRHADERLKVLRAFAERTHSTWHLYAIQALQALVAAGLGQRAEALQVLRQALQAARPQRFMRSFADAGGPTIEDLVRELRTQDVQRHGISRATKPYLTYLDLLLAAFCSRPSSTSVALLGVPIVQGGIVDPLTARELEVLQYLAQRLTDKEIAQELMISSFTVHTHTHSIYRKLEVTDRRAAVAKAKALGLLAS